MVMFLKFESRLWFQVTWPAGDGTNHARGYGPSPKYTNVKWLSHLASLTTESRYFIRLLTSTDWKWKGAEGPPLTHPCLCDRKLSFCPVAGSGDAPSLVTSPSSTFTLSLMRTLTSISHIHSHYDPHMHIGTCWLIWAPMSSHKVCYEGTEAHCPVFHCDLKDTQSTFTAALMALQQTLLLPSSLLHLLFPPPPFSYSSSCHQQVSAFCVTV